MKKGIGKITSIFILFFLIHATSYYPSHRMVIGLLMIMVVVGVAGRIIEGSGGIKLAAELSDGIQIVS